jgi:PIN domain nuclease of toxin-antitoxin system
MRYLLDTHIILWALGEKEKLSKSAYDIISDGDFACFASIISFFEMSIKKKVGKLDLDKPVSAYLKEADKIGIQILPIKEEYLDHYEKLALLDGHRDPFDRLIIATACVEGLTIISADGKFGDYEDVMTNW